jgi:hypothetical protein
MPGDEAADEFDVLNGQRIGEAERLPNGLFRARARPHVAGEHRIDDVAGKQAHERKDQHRHADQRRDEQQKAADRVASHLLGPV